MTHTHPPNLLFHDLKEVASSDVTQGLVVIQYGVTSLCGGDVRCLLTCLCPAADVPSIDGELNFVVLQLGDGDQVRALVAGCLRAQVEHGPVWVQTVVPSDGHYVEL